MTTAAFKDIANGQGSSTLVAQATLVTWSAPASNCVVEVEARYVGRDNTNNKTVGFVIRATFGIVAGVAAQIGTNTTIDSKIEAGCFMTVPSLQSSGSGFVLKSGVPSQNTSALHYGECTIVAFQFS